MQSLSYTSPGLHVIIWREVWNESDMQAVKAIADEDAYKSAMIKKAREEAFKMLDAKMEKDHDEAVAISTWGEFEHQRKESKEIVYRFQINIQPLGEILEERKEK